MHRESLAARWVPALALTSAIVVACSNTGSNVAPKAGTAAPVADSPATAAPAVTSSDASAAASVSSSDASAATAAVNPTDASTDGSATCTPNVGASCSSTQDCAQCADVPGRIRRNRTQITTTVECVNAVCTKTGCPTQACGQGQVCMGCVANLPCRCVAKP